MLPSDVTGVSIYNQVSKQFEFRLEAMQEQQVTVDGTSYQLPKPFMVLAT